MKTILFLDVDGDPAVGGEVPTVKQLPEMRAIKGNYDFEKVGQSISGATRGIRLFFILEEGKAYHITEGAKNRKKSWFCAIDSDGEAIKLKRSDLKKYL